MCFVPTAIQPLIQKTFTFALYIDVYIDALELKVQLLIDHIDIHPYSTIQVLKFTKDLPVN